MSQRQNCKQPGIPGTEDTVTGDGRATGGAGWSCPLGRVGPVGEPGEVGLRSCLVAGQAPRGSIRR